MRPKNERRAAPARTAPQKSIDKQHDLPTDQPARGQGLLAVVNRLSRRRLALRQVLERLVVMLDGPPADLALQGLQADLLIQRGRR